MSSVANCTQNIGYVLGSKGPRRITVPESPLLVSPIGVYSHFVQLFIHIFIIFIVLAQLGDQSPIGQGEELRALKEIQKAIRTKPSRESLVRVWSGLEATVRIQKKVTCAWWKEHHPSPLWRSQVIWLPRINMAGPQPATIKWAVKGTSYTEQSLFQHAKVGFCQSRTHHSCQAQAWVTSIWCGSSSHSLDTVKDPSQTLTN